MAAARGRWAGHDIEFVRANYGRRPARWIARRVRRDEAKVHQVGASVRNGVPSNADELLREALFHKVPPAEIAVRLGAEERDIVERIEILRAAARDEALPRAQYMLFKRFYGGVPDEDLVACFGIRIERLREAASFLTLRKDKALVRKLRGKTLMPRWTADDIARLRELYPTASNIEIARQLGKSSKSVVSKAHHLRLKKSPERLRIMGRENVATRYQ